MLGDSANPRTECVLFPLLVLNKSRPASRQLDVASVCFIKRHFLITDLCTLVFKITSFLPNRTYWTGFVFNHATWMSLFYFCVDACNKDEPSPRRSSDESHRICHKKFKTNSATKVEHDPVVVVLTVLSASTPPWVG